MQKKILGICSALGVIIVSAHVGMLAVIVFGDLAPEIYHYLDHLGQRHDHWLAQYVVSTGGVQIVGILIGGLVYFNLWSYRRAAALRVDR